MSRHRLIILIFGPIPIVIVSLALTRWARSDAQPVEARNHVVIHSPAVRAPQAVRTGAARDASLDAECQRVAGLLKGRLGAECAVIVRAPFVVAGDLSGEQLEDWHRRTIGPAVRAMQQTYFDVAPDRPVTLLLFDGQASYEAYARQLYGEEGISVFGYYKPGERVLLANVRTGGGTLVHELTHALMDFDFREVPDWFNEGLASMHEQCRILSDESGVVGLVNWRLPGLQEALEQGRLRPLELLVREGDFRRRDVDLNYAQARYLCLWLQEQGRLAAFYREFRDNCADDPTGEAALRRVLGDRGWEEIDAEYRAWVGRLVWVSSPEERETGTVAAD